MIVFLDMEESYDISDVELFFNMQIFGQICKLASIIISIVINFPYFSNYTRMPNSHKIVLPSFPECD